MKTLIKFLALAILLGASSAFAQDFQGVATYKSQRQMNIELDSSQVSSEMHQQMMAMMKKQFEKTYLLTFNKEESLYKEDEQLEAPQTAGVQMVMVDTRGGDILYKNTKENTYTSQNEVFGKIFLIEDEINKRDWVLTNETKNIGEYTCYKATMTREQEVVRSVISINGDNDDEDEDAEPEMEEITVTAWYTTEIPVNNGPARYQGLPGLILEVTADRSVILCTKIVMNPQEKDKIEKPEKGDVVTRDEYNQIMKDKIQEMREMYGGRNRGRRN